MVLIALTEEASTARRSRHQGPDLKNSIKQPARNKGLLPKSDPIVCIKATDLYYSVVGKPWIERKHYLRRPLEHEYI